MQDFKRTDVWKRSYKFSIDIYRITSSFPPEEKYGLTSQIRRASTSIPINIAEGAGRDTRKEFAHFILIAMGSASEVDCELLLAHDLGFISNKDFSILYSELNEIRKMLTAFRKSLLNYNDERNKK